MTTHSVCQPGRPGPHGDAQLGSPGLAFFHSTKSSGRPLLLAGLDPAPRPAATRGAGGPAARSRARRSTDR